MVFIDNCLWPVQCLAFLPLAARMCIFSGPVAGVHGTKIFTTLLADGRQFTCYRNKVQLENAQPVAMLLPFPNPTGATTGTIEMFDMSQYERFFDDLETCFPDPRANTKGVRSMSLAGFGSTSPIPVLQCGPYDYSMAPTYDELANIQWEHFAINPSVKGLLATHYAQGFGFLVCLCTKSGAYSTLGVLHPPRAPGVLYVPTMHAHGGDDDGPVDWDHVIYVLNGVNKSSTMETSTGEQVELSLVQGADQDPVRALEYARLPLGFPKLVEGDLGHFNKYVITDDELANGDLHFLDAASFVAARWSRCSLDVTNEQFAHQLWYHCTTCFGANVHAGLCPHCAQAHAHAGHATRLANIGSAFFCDVRKL